MGCSIGDESSHLLRHLAALLVNEMLDGGYCFLLSNPVLLLKHLPRLAACRFFYIFLRVRCLTHYSCRLHLEGTSWSHRSSNSRKGCSLHCTASQGAIARVSCHECLLAPITLRTRLSHDGVISCVSCYCRCTIRNRTLSPISGGLRSSTL